MTVRQNHSVAKRGVHRRGKRVYLILEFPDEYQAMQAFDVWSMESVDLHFHGPVSISEQEEITPVEITLACRRDETDIQVSRQVPLADRQDPGQKNRSAISRAWYWFYVACCRLS